MDETIFTDIQEDKTQNAEPSNDTKTHSNNDDLLAVTPALEKQSLRKHAHAIYRDFKSCEK